MEDFLTAIEKHGQTSFIIGCFISYIVTSLCRAIMHRKDEEFDED